MKLYTGQAPNPFRVNVFLAEKNLQLPTQIVDIGGGTRSADFLALNSLGELPVLELDDGSLLTESVAICRYLDSLFPETPLSGATALETAKIDMWTRRIEQHIMATIGQVGLHTFALFADKIEQIPAYAESQRRQLAKKWAWLNAELSDGRSYVCDDAFSIADITGMASLMVCDFAGEAVPSELEHVKRWEQAVRGRPSWKAAALAAAA